jgi:tRNA dimethylallyltransferase
MPRPLALVGPTASGKTEAAIALAEALSAEIVSVDSMLVYRGMDVGTAKPTMAQRAMVPHHMIDVVDPRETFSVARYQELGRAAMGGIADRGHVCLLAGGSGLYFRALVDDLEFPGTDPGTRANLEAESIWVGSARLHGRLAELDPAAAAKIEPQNVRRTVRALEVAAITGRRFSSFSSRWEEYPPERVRAAGVAMSPGTIDARVRHRIETMLEEGFLAEVRRLVDLGLGGWLTSTQAIGYAEFAQQLEGRISLEEAVEQTRRRTRALARRQMSWFRRDPRVHWFEAGPEGAIGLVEAIRSWLGEV